MRDKCKNVRDMKVKVRNVWRLGKGKTESESVSRKVTSPLTK